VTLWGQLLVRLVTQMKPSTPKSTTCPTIKNVGPDITVVEPLRLIIERL